MASNFWNNLSGAVRRFGDRLADTLGGRTGAKADGPRAFGAAAAFGVLALGLGGWIVLATINRLGQPLTLGNGNANQSSAIAELTRLQAKDTDEDGLSDYDELYRLKTSPYLQDSDSDGVKDADEVNRGGDPNCPEGKSCTGLVTTVTPGQGELTPEFLRQALRDAGVAQSVLDGLPDDQLIGIYQEVTQTGGSVNTNGAQPLPTRGSRGGLGGAEIRQIFIQAGVSATELQDVDDTTLKQIFEQALQSDTSP